MNLSYMILAFALAVAPCAATADELVTEVVADLDADGHEDTAALYEVAGRLELIVVRGGSVATHKQILTFDVDPTVQAAVCALPARLEVTPLSCEPMGDRPLLGCRESPLAHSLVLSGGECDAIVLYWNHSDGQMAWERL